MVNFRMLARVSQSTINFTVHLVRWWLSFRQCGEIAKSLKANHYHRLALTKIAMFSRQFATCNNPDCSDLMLPNLMAQFWTERSSRLSTLLESVPL